MSPRTRRGRGSSGKYIEHVTRVVVRFQEVDSLKIVWHGHYLSYFEDARVGLGRSCGLDYEDMLRAGFLVPIVHVSVDYFAAAEYGDELDVTARLFWNEAAKIEFGYEVVRKKDKLLLAAGRTMQVFTDIQSKMILVLPDFMRKFYARWEVESKTR